MTPTPSAREPQAIAALRAYLHNGGHHSGAPTPTALSLALDQLDGNLRDVLTAYDALAAEREAITRLAGSLQDDVAALREAEESLTRQRDEAEQRRTMADECLAMIYQKLVQIKGEESMKSCPPMFYPEAIHNINAAKLHAERERDALRGVVEKARALPLYDVPEWYDLQEAIHALDGEARG